MNKFKLPHQSGSAAWELIVGVVLFVVVALAGFYLFNSSYTKSINTTAGKSASVNYSVTVPSPPQINSSADLNKAYTVLNQVDPSSSNNSDNSQLTTQANF